MLHASTSPAITEEESQTFARQALWQLMGQADEVPPHINASCQHARNITEKWNENFPRALNARSPLASRCCTSLRDCVAAQSNRAHAHEDPTTGRSAQPSQIHDVEVLAILSPCESQLAAAQRSNSSNAWMRSYPASDKSRAFTHRKYISR